MACKEEEKSRYPEKLTIGRQIVKKILVEFLCLYEQLEKTEAESYNFEREIPELYAESDYYHIHSYLKLSYCHLLSHLKQCIALCSLFPKDWVIDKLMLTSLWMAEGFFQPIDNIGWDMEDIAHYYLMDLVRRDFFQDCTKDELGNAMSCKMHGFVNELACAVARAECSRDIDSAWSLNDERTQHVSWDSMLDLSQKLPTTLLGAKRPRTFIKLDQTKCLSCETLMVGKTFFELTSNFKLLRALDWHDCGVEKLPSSIYFLLAGDDSCPKNGGGLGELNRLSSWRGSLRIEFKGEIGDAVAQANAANLKEKNSLVLLVLVFGIKESDEVLLKELQPSTNLRGLEIRGYGGTRIPSWMSRMPELVELRLCHCAACKSLPPLGELTNLKRLKIDGLPIVKCTKSDHHALS
ncbi:hypothetical protein EUGRSUZ_E02644 [Eucalyptus grandis]|uniref:NB-ARC domain-containing protein n=2 Tax=Eucalyptus grandis TaxID=71139 RepID=A0A059C6D9_EUCGR|nr:hypothetical protein EUGRSUZ_E02644 [Eucalyptus grandis]